METFLSFLSWKTGIGVDDVSQLVRNNERQRNNNNSFVRVCTCVCLQVEPYLPYEYTCEGMLERVHAYIQNQVRPRGSVTLSSPPLQSLRCVTVSGHMSPVT